MNDLPGFILSALLGAALGSFANVCILRLPQGESVVRPRSHCPRCQKLIRWYDNIPLLSFFFLRGRCRFCKAPISLQYPLVEGMSALLALGLYTLLGWSFSFWIYLYFLLSLLVIVVIDARHQIIPDLLTFPGIGVGLGSSFFLPTGSPIQSFLGCLIGGGSLYLVAFVYRSLRGVEGLGGGDVKLLAMIGSFLGIFGAFLALFIGSLLGSLVGLFLWIRYRKGLKTAIPFGPFLSIAAAALLFWGEKG